MKYTLRSGVIQGNLSGQASVHTCSSHRSVYSLFYGGCTVSLRLHHRKQFQSSVSQTGNMMDSEGS